MRSTKRSLANRIPLARLFPFIDPRGMIDKCSPAHPFNQTTEENFVYPYDRQNADAVHQLRRLVLHHLFIRLLF